MTGMLASVTSLFEAKLVMRAGVDIIDLKQPANGALGALETESICHIRNYIGKQTLISATIGDLPMTPQRILDAVLRMNATGVDFIKIGFFPGGDWKGTIDALAAPARSGAKLVAVFFADASIGTEWVNQLADCGFSGAMIDTMNKSNGSLTAICPRSKLESFVGKVQSKRLLCGLAGSLRKGDIPELIRLSPDYLGFRGALCVQKERTNGLDESAVKAIRSLIDNCYRGQPIRDSQPA